MLFTEALFFLFFIVVFVVHWVLPGNRARKVWLLFASYAFYANWDWRFLGLILASTAIDFAVGARLAVETRQPGRRAWLALSLAGNLGILGFFKYYGFFVDSAVAMLQASGFAANPSTLQIILPVGISFYTFQTLSYTIDIYRGRLRPTRSPVDFALFVAFFPQLVAGPIVRASHFLPQLLEKRRFSNVDTRALLTLFLFGYVKKACVADNFAVVVDRVFDDPGAHVSASLWLADAMYAVQIYCDFSGYSDMAIAIAGLLGYRLALNFDFPYLAATIADFWRRWHISLSTWFRDYVYISFGGNRRSRGRTYVNLAAVFFLCGLWHGAAWSFVVWGLIHGAFLVIERLGGRLGRGAPRWAAHAYTLLVVLLAWVFFRAPDLSSAVVYLHGMFGLGSGMTVVDPRWWLAPTGFAVVHVVMRRCVIEEKVEALPTTVFAAAYGAALALALPWASAEYQPFIYFQF